MVDDVFTHHFVSGRNNAFQCKNNIWPKCKTEDGHAYRKRPC